MKRILWTISSVLAALGIAAALLISLNLRGEEPLPAGETLQSTPELIQRGEYLARVGNCMACHTTQGGAPFAGGRGIETPFGVVHSSNLTPDKAHGIGSWTSAEFWRAMHHGRSKDGRLLYPAFPYPNYTQVTREDSDAIFAYLHSLPAAAEANRDHALRFPYNTQAALGVWRALFFTPGAPQPEVTQTAEYNRGAYLVNGLGHCSACHGSRNLLGASERLAGNAHRTPVLTSTTADAIAGASKRNESLHFGVADFAASMKMRTTQIGGPHPDYVVLSNADEAGKRETYWGDMWHYALARMVVAARANGLRPVDGPFGDFSDPDGYRAAAKRAAVLGCEGKWAIHPSQIALANEVMSPSEAEVTRAKRILEAMAQAAAEGKGAVSLDGRLIDYASIRQAEVLVQKARQISAA